ncbi:DinB family protein [Candidatus Poribacteria bacterium]
MTAKKLIIKQMDDAFSGDDEMSLKASLGKLTQEEASWRPNDKTWTIEEIIYHIAYWKIEYCIEEESYEPRGSSISGES